MRNLLLALLITALAGAAPAVSETAGRHDTLAAHQHGDQGVRRSASVIDEFARAMSVAMDKMHQDMSAPRPTGDPDVDFLAMMIPHHAGAVEMARLLLVYGRDPLVRQLAEEIIASQQAEINAMQARLAILARGIDPNPDGFPAISGTRGTDGVDPVPK